MSFLKILGGAAAGVGAVAFAPTEEPVLAISSLKAAAAVLSKNKEGDKKKEKEAFRNGKKVERAKNAKEIEKFAVQLQEASERFKEHSEYEDLLIAMFAVGISVANCDGEIDPQEKINIDTFIAGIAATSLPESVKKVINQLYDAPPSFNDAMKYVEKVAKPNRELFGTIIAITSESDGVVCDEEVAFKAAWEIHKKAA